MGRQWIAYISANSRLKSRAMNWNTAMATSVVISSVAPRPGFTGPRHAPETDRQNRDGARSRLHIGGPEQVQQARVPAPLVLVTAHRRHRFFGDPRQRTVFVQVI